MRGSRALVLLALGATLFTPGSSRTGDLTFRERVEAQRAIERVYYSHQIGATRTFEKAVPESLLERKVRTTLAESAALERFWGTPISAAALQAEWQRIARSSRFPERLEEIYAALDHDSVLIQETFVRSVLADRLSRNFFKTDERIHSGSRHEIEALHEKLVTGDFSEDSEESHRTVWELIPIGDVGAQAVASGGYEPAPQSAGKAEPREGVRSLKVKPEELERWRRSTPSRVGEIGEIRDEGDAWSIGILLGEEDGSLRIARYAVPKVGWDEWWEGTKNTWEEGRVATVAQPFQALTPPTLDDSCTAPDRWENGILDAAPRPATGHVAVWTGSLMVVWGGTSDETPTGLGARYDPLTDTWSRTSTVGAPSPRYLSPTAVWTGQQMIVWGGWPFNLVGNVLPNVGGRYDPVSDTWQATSTSGAPEGRFGHSAVWTGSVMLIWGGQSYGGFLNPGGQYEPATDTWSPISALGQPNPRSSHSAIWTGSRMLVWGGAGYVGPNFVHLNTGGLYDPVTNTWSATSTLNAPSARLDHSAIWTGTRMIVWGGMADSVENTGRSYDPVGDTWGNVATMNAPSARKGHQAIWTGSRMIVWGGGFNTGGSYNPANDHWSPTSTTNAPSARSGSTAVWTGSKMIVWGGLPTAGGVSVNTGGQYDPAGNSWTPTSSTQEVTARIDHTAVWTGNEMIIWGGSEQNLRVNTGGRYNPTSDSWTPTTLSGAPAARAVHVAVWTGNKMVVWGGGGTNGAYLLTGGRYDPILDSWSPMTSLNPPPGREYASAIWTGTEMIVWGGDDGIPVDTGGRYNPATDSWIATAWGPDARAFHSAVWTGSRMIIWGGGSDTGAQYNPATNSWTPTSTVNAPSARTLQSGVWTGDRMIIWGGYSVPDGADVSTGSKYDPATDSWTPISAVNAPAPRELNSAVWDGSRMVIWGGLAPPDSHPISTGGSYNPVTNSWSPTSLLDAPSPRARHTAISAGPFMIVWGGHPQHSTPYNMLSSGGRYSPTGFDQDEDGFTTCAGDCNDTNPAVHPGAPEICDGLDNNCNGTVDEIVDADTDGFTNCGGDCNDSNPAVHPGATEVCNGIDDDCDNAVDESMPDADGDGFDACADCNDAAASVHPGAVEVCNGVDDNCSGVADEGFLDSDGDGSADCADCQDFDPSIYPGAAEVCNQIDDNCNELIDEGFD
ncbi:MAG TPA: MopE-related protein, partial [Candidatus Polarisedimenticolia bacterium]|nr:MopE-related protein [Candidatus Polarisedimenticolia bacterium]